MKILLLEKEKNNRFKFIYYTNKKKKIIFEFYSNNIDEHKISHFYKNLFVKISFIRLNLNYFYKNNLNNFIHYYVNKIVKYFILTPLNKHQNINVLLVNEKWENFCEIILTIINAILYISKKIFWLKYHNLKIFYNTKNNSNFNYDMITENGFIIYGMINNKIVFLENFNYLIDIKDLENIIKIKTKIINNSNNNNNIKIKIHNIKEKFNIEYKKLIRYDNLYEDFFKKKILNFFNKKYDINFLRLNLYKFLNISNYTNIDNNIIISKKDNYYFNNNCKLILKINNFSNFKINYLFLTQNIDITKFRWRNTYKSILYSNLFYLTKVKYDLLILYSNRYEDYCINRILNRNIILKNKIHFVNKMYFNKKWILFPHKNMLLISNNYLKFYSKSNNILFLSFFYSKGLTYKTFLSLLL